jgi:hypothetical protein
MSLSNRRDDQTVDNQQPDPLGTSGRQRQHAGSIAGSRDTGKHPAATPSPLHHPIASAGTAQSP